MLINSSKFGGSLLSKELFQLFDFSVELESYADLFTLKFSTAVYRERVLQIELWYQHLVR